MNRAGGRKETAQDTASASRFDHLIKVFDVGAKVVAAAAVAFVSWIAANYESTVSGVSLLSQREQAESNLSASMFSNLIDPVVGRPPEGQRPDAHRERVLVELLTLNFHHAFEFKPLLVDVDQRLAQLKNDEGRLGRDSLESIARRVIERQMNMLMAAAESTHQEPPVVRDMWFEGLNVRAATSPGDDELPGDRIDAAKSDRKSIRSGCQAGSSELEPARFFDLGADEDPAAQQSPTERRTSSEAICIPSDDGKYLIAADLTAVDWQRKQFRVELTVLRKAEPDRECELLASAYGNSWCQGIATPTFTLTPFDFPLTDNFTIGPKDRFSLVLWKSNEGEHRVWFRLIWFPHGFITARERPLNYQDIRNTLGLGE